jgi:hypothetical protein
MRLIRILLNHRLSGELFDARVGELIGYVAGLAIVPMAVVALIRHPGSRADFLLGVGLAGLMALLFVMLGMLSRQVVAFGGKLVLRSRWPEFVSYVACMVVMIAGIRSLASLGLTPVQITLGLLLICSMGIAVLVLGMMTTVVRSLKG